MTDADVRVLLGLLALYAAEYGSDSPGLTVTEIADDIVMSLDAPTAADIDHRAAIRAALGEQVRHG